MTMMMVKISFVTEQLKLLSKHKSGQNYSLQLTVLSYLFYSTSAAPILSFSM